MSNHVVMPVMSKGQRNTLAGCWLRWCSLLNGVPLGPPKKEISTYNRLEPMNGVLFGKMVFADVIKYGSQDEIVLDYPGGPKKQMTSVLIKRHTKENRRRPCDNGSRKGLVMQPQNKKRQEPPKAGRGWEGQEGLSLEPSEKHGALHLDLDFCSPNCERTLLCCSQPPRSC